MGPSPCSVSKQYSSVHCYHQAQEVKGRQEAGGCKAEEKVGNAEQWGWMLYAEALMEIPAKPCGVTVSVPSSATGRFLCISEQKRALKSRAERGSRKPTRLHSKHEELAAREPMEDPGHRVWLCLWEACAQKRENTVDHRGQDVGRVGITKQDSLLQESLRKDRKLPRRH